MAKDINKKNFSEETKLKLDIFAECFREWFPVFIHNPFINELYIYDFFAGSGKDTDGNFGSPLILLDESKGENKEYCSNIKTKKITFQFNEIENKKLEELKANVEKYMSECLRINKCNHGCVYKNIIFFSFQRSCVGMHTTYHCLQSSGNTYAR